MSDLWSLSSKSVLVTGASSGIGREVSLSLAGGGARLFCTGRSEEELKNTISLMDNPADHRTLPADLSLAEDLKRLADEVEPLDGLVLNAGAVKLMPAKFVKEDQADWLFDVNIKSSIFLIKNLLRAKKLKDGASIVFVSSIASLKPTKGNSVYSATKGAINSYAKSLALELAPKKIRVNSILPGFIQTQMTLGGDLNLGGLGKHLENYPLGRFGQPADVAAMVYFLLSDQAAWVTGGEFKVDGGFSLT